MRRCLYLLLIWCVPMLLMAQQARYDKMSPLLRQLARQQTALSRSDGGRSVAKTQATVCAFVKTTDPNALSDHGCRVLAHAGTIYIATIPIDALSALSLDTRVLRMEARQGNSITTDQMATHINALPAYEGRDLPQAYTGQGVVVGLMDIGFDLTHPTFYSRDTTEYRISRFWDMLSADTVGSPLYVGRDYAGREALLTYAHSRDGLDQTHGTHTAGIAVGSGYDSPYRGVAPDADICLVSNAVTEDVALIDSADYYKYTFATDALGFKYMFDYARQMGKPCVLSFSEGSTQDFFGYDLLYYEMLDSLVGPGRIIVAAAGNNGHYKSWFRKPAGIESMGTFLYSDKSSVMFVLKSASDFSLRVVSYGEHNDTTLVPMSEVLLQPDSVLTLPGITLGAYPSCYVPEELCYDVVLTGQSPLGGSPRLSAEIVGAEADVEFWRVTGSLIEDALNPLLCAGEYVGSIHSPGSAPCVICVGATIHRDSILNVNGQWMVSKAGENGMRTYYSSVGPTYDGRTKPDVMAPGSNIISSYSSYYLETHPDANDIAWDVAHFDFRGRTYPWNSNSGTSMSCPAVAGAIALWLQAKPDLTPAQAMDVIRRTSRHPDATLDYPNNLYGYGEIDVYRGLLDILGVSQIEEVSARHTAARIAISGNTLSITLDEPLTAPARLRLYNMSGRLVKTTALSAGQCVFTTPLGHLPAGIYAVQLDGPASVGGSSLVRL